MAAKAAKKAKPKAGPASDSRVGVWSEIGKLRRVLVCQPDLAHQRLTPENSAELLFDDVIWLAQARRDHFDFVSKMEDHGVEVYDLQDCLAEVLKDHLARAWVLDRRLTDYLVGPNISLEMRPWLEEMDAATLARYLIGGIAFHDVPKDVAGPFPSTFAETEPAGFVIAPLPNTQFMRDNSSWIFHGVTLNPMYWPARQPETLSAYSNSDSR